MSIFNEHKSGYDANCHEIYPVLVRARARKRACVRACVNNTLIDITNTKAIQIITPTVTTPSGAHPSFRKFSTASKYAKGTTGLAAKLSVAAAISSSE